MTEVQVIQTVDCHCDAILMDEFRVFADLDACNDSLEISVSANLQLGVNMVYLTDYFGTEDLFNITSDTRLNESLQVQLPKLAWADKLLNEQFTEESAAEFDMEKVINATKASGVVCDDLAHFLFNKMIRAHDMSNQFDLLSPWTWLTIFGWLASGATLVLVIMLRLKVCPLFLLLMARGSHGAPVAMVDNFPRVLSMTTTVTSAQPRVHVMAQWAENVSHVPSMEIIVLRHYTDDAPGHAVTHPSLPALSGMFPTFSAPNLLATPQKA